MYQATQPTMTVQTPSSTHVHHGVIQLNFNRTGGTQLGSRLHQIFEHLPHTGVSAEMIRLVDSDLSETQVQDILAYYEASEYQHFVKGDIRHEFPFYINLEGSLTHGYMDCVSIGKTIMLVDYKSDQLSEASAFIEAYVDQIDLYRRVLQQMFPHKTIQAYIYSLKLRKWIEL